MAFAAANRTRNVAARNDTAFHVRLVGSDARCSGSGITTGVSAGSTGAGGDHSGRYSW